MKILIAGTGSIGRRHIRNLLEILESPQFIFLRESEQEDELSQNLNATVIGDFRTAIGQAPDLAVISSPSSMHLAALESLLPAGIPCYIEKPVVVGRRQTQSLRDLLERIPNLPSTLVGCNLRYLPSLKKFRDVIHAGEIGRIVRVSMQAGQWLPDWRPTQDYRAGYSADTSKGGGVVMDLIHELDAARWIFGEFEKIAAIGGKYSDLEINSEDAAGILLGRANGPVVSIGLDYIARVPVRRYEVLGVEGTLAWDLPMKRLEMSGPGGSVDLSGLPGDWDTNATYQTAMQEILCSIRAGEPTTQDIWEGLASASLADHVLEALRK